MKTAVPTRKWLAAQVVAAGAVALMWATTGGWDQEETVALIGWLVQAATTYLVPNEDTPGGVPSRPRSAVMESGRRGR